MEKSSDYGNYAASLAGSMFDYNYKDLLTGDYFYDTFNKTIIDEFMKSISIDNCLIFLGASISPKKIIIEKYFAGKTEKKTEKWYKTEYLESKLTRSQKSDLKGINKKFLFNSFNTSNKNNFITNETSPIFCENENECFNNGLEIIKPEVYYNNTHLKMWYKVISN